MMHPFLTTEKMGVLATCLTAVANIYRSNVRNKVLFGLHFQGKQ